MVSESIPSLVADLQALVIRRIDAMSHPSILKGRINDLETTLSSNNALIGELE